MIVNWFDEVHGCNSERRIKIPGMALAAEHSLCDSFEDRFRIKIAIATPDFSAESSYESWSQAVLEQRSWADDGDVTGLGSITDQEHLFFVSLLKTFRLLSQLGRLPLFDVPRVISLVKDGQTPEKYLMEIELPLDQVVPQVAYEIPMKVAADLCRWMARHSPTPENKSKVFNTIEEKVIKPMRQLVPAGKSTIPLLREAHQLGIPFTHLGLGVYQVGWGSKARRLDRSICELDSVIGSRLAQDKLSTANILRAAGLPSPVHGVAAVEHDAIAIALKIGFPIVVKPADRDRGEGVTVDIVDERELTEAFIHAQKMSKSRQVIVERQVPGVCHRLFIANGRLLYAVKRHPMSVFGDGRKTIRQLVDDEVAKQNRRPPWSRSEIRPMDGLALKSIASLGLSPDAIPEKGGLIPLRRIESTEWGGVDENVTREVHPQNREIALLAAKLFGLHVAGIDIISSNIAEPWFTNGAIINEVNLAPLFGGAAISKSCIPQFFAEFIDGDGKIPILFFDTEKAALAFHREQIAKGKRCYFICAERTLDSHGNSVVLPFKGTNQVIRALTLRPDVEAIAVLRDETI